MGNGSIIRPGEVQYMAAGTGVQTDDGIAGVVFATEHPLHLGLADLLFELCELFFDLGGGLRVPRLCQLEKNMGVVQPARLFFPLGNNVGQGGAFFEDSLGFFLILPELLCRGQGVELSGARLFASEVKDASRGSRPGHVAQQAFP